LKLDSRLRGNDEKDCPRFTSAFLNEWSAIAFVHGGPKAKTIAMDRGLHRSIRQLSHPYKEFVMKTNTLVNLIALLNLFILLAAAFTVSVIADASGTTQARANVTLRSA
jgi:hypothetical protein